VLRQKWSRGQVEARLANMPPCLIGMEACVGAHHLSRKLQCAWSRCPADAGEVRPPYSKGQKNDFNDAEAIAEAVQRPTMKFVATKTAEQLGSAGAASGARAAGVATHRHHQPDSRLHAGTRDRVRQGIGFLRTNCPPSLRRAPMPCRHAVACHRGVGRRLASGWISASMAYPARSKHWPVKIRHVRA
jgi:hypothetical protein